MGKTAILAVRIVSDAVNGNKGFQESEKAAGKWERGLGKANKVALGMLAGVTALGLATKESASRAEQAAGAVEAAFGRQAGAVKDLARNAAGSVGLATSEYSELASVLGSQLRNLGVSEDQLVGTTDDLITRGADLAATFGGTTADAVGALSALMRGERDPIEQYGVSIKDADIKAKLAADGLSGLTGAARKQAETQATLAILTEQTANAQGQFARETGSAAGASQIAGAEFENMKAALGTALLPIVVLVGGALAKMAGFIGGNTRLVTILITAVAGLAAIIVTANAGIKAYAATHKVLSTVLRVGTGDTIRHRVATLASAAAQKVVKGATLGWAAAQKILNLAMRANPIGIVITVIAALVAIVITAYKKSETFRNIVQSAGRVAVSVWKAIKKAAEPIVRIVQKIVGWVQSLIGAIRGIRWPEPPGWVKSIGSAIGGLFGASDYPGPHEPGFSHTWSPVAPGRVSFMPHAGGGSSGDVMGALAALGAGGGLTIINVSGALDPDAVARQIEQLLSRRGSRVGRGLVTT